MVETALVVIRRETREAGRRCVVVAVDGVTNAIAVHDNGVVHSRAGSHGSRA